MSNSLTFGYCDPGFNCCDNGGGSGNPGAPGPQGPQGPQGLAVQLTRWSGNRWWYWGGALRVGLSGNNGQVGPSQIENLYFNTDDGFTYTDIPGLIEAGLL